MSALSRSKSMTQRREQRDYRMTINGVSNKDDTSLVTTVDGIEAGPGGRNDDGLLSETTPLLARTSSSGGSRIWRDAFAGLTMSPELVAISLVYFVQGILGLSKLALSFFFKDELGLTPAQVAVLTGLSGLPWVVKPLYGFISDSIPLLGYRRRSYLVLCGLLGTLSWLALATVVDGPTAAVVAMIIASLGTAFSDVVVDSIVVERARGEDETLAGSLQSLCWASAAVGGIASSYFSGSLVQEYGTHFVFGLTAIFPLIVSASALLITEERIGGGNRRDDKRRKDGLDPPTLSLSKQLSTQSRALWSAFSRKDILLPTAFVFLWQATPSAETAMFYFQTNQLHFTPEFLGRVRLAGSIATLVGVGVYNTFLKRVPLRRMLLWTMILGTVLGGTQLILITGAHRTFGLSDQLFVLGDSVILTVLAQVAFMPILVLAARLCPEGVEATLFATLMSISNGGSFTGSALGGGLTSALGVTSTNFDNLFPLVLICTLSGLLPAPFLWLLPNEVDQDTERKQSAGSSSDHGGTASRKESV